jgi:2'-5' RNA ligase
VRLFVAIPLPSDVAARASALLPEALPALRRVKAENLHVTLAFLGWTPDERLPDVAAAAAEAAAAVAPFVLAFEGAAGRFPERGRPRVVWLGIGAGLDSVRRLGERVGLALRERSVPFDDRPLAAHLTLARVRDDASLAEARTVAAALEALAVPRLETEVREITVFESVLSPRGPRYTARAQAPLLSQGE